MDHDRRNWMVTFLTRSPFPSLNSYIIVSTLLASVAVANVVNTLRTQPELRLLLREEIQNKSDPWLARLDPNTADVLTSNAIVHGAYYVISQQPLVWVAVNTYFAMFALASKLLIEFFCRELSRQEESVLRHGFFSFALFTIVFLTAVASISNGYTILAWLFWLGFVGFMNSLHLIAHQRFKYIAPASGVTGGRLSWLCFFLFVCSYVAFHAVVRFRHLVSLSHFLFLLIDCIVSLCRASHGLLRCLSASERFSRSPDAVRHFNYWLDLVVLIVVDIIQMFNFVHLMFYSPIGFNVTCMFFFYHMKLSYSSITTTLNRHRKHQQIFQHILTTYPTEKAPEGDLCIVCWEALGESRRLPCSHQFHDWCLMWWLAQDASCPTCRRAISAPQPPAQPPTQSTTIRFGGGFGFLRLPSFVIEVSTNSTMLGPLFRRQPVDDSQLMGMTQQVREMFPQISQDAVLNDLRISGSAQATIENILEGRVGFIGDIAEDESFDSDEESWHGGDGDTAVEEDAPTSRDSISLEEPEWENGETEFAKRRKAMIAHYRKRYIASERGKDLRDKGINC